MKLIEIKSRLGTFITLDKEVAEKIGDWGWFLLPDGYVTAHLPGSGEEGKKVRLSRAVIWASTGEWPPDDMQVDHIIHDKLDNRMENLRVVTRSVNNKNKIKQEGASSHFQGVFWHKMGQKWHAQAGVSIGKKQYYVRSSHTPDEAIAAKCADVMRLLIGGWHESKLNYSDMSFEEKWEEIGERQRKQILHSLEKHGF